MSSYDKEYYFIEKPAGREDLPSLSPDVNTEDRRFRFEAQPMGSPPLVFINTAAEYSARRGVKSIAVPPAILFEGANPVVCTPIRNALIEADIPHLHLHPAVYIHDDGQWYEDYWYMTFTQRFDCWDRDNSDYDRDDPPVRLGGFELEQVYSYSLNDQLLARTALAQRQLFQMGGVLDAAFVCHESLARLFRQNRPNGAQLTPITDY